MNLRKRWGYWLASILLGATALLAYMTITIRAAAAVLQAPGDYTLNVLGVGSGIVLLSSDQTIFHSGDVITLTALPDEGWSFAGWSGDLVTTTNPAALTITGNAVVTATFTQDGYTLDVTVVGSGGVTRLPDQPTYLFGDRVRLTAIPDPNWTFTGWSGDVVTTTNPFTLTMMFNAAVTANFIEGAFTLGVNVNGSGSVGRDPDLPAYKDGAVITLTARADPGWSFTGWSGALTGAANPAHLTMHGNAVVTATFTQDAYTLGVSVVGGGAVQRNPDHLTYPYGQVITLTATANPGWTFAGWSGAAVTSDNPLVITMTSSTALTATFTENEYTLNVTIQGSGSINRLPNQPTYEYGNVITLTATPAFGWNFSGWSGDKLSSLNPLVIQIGGNVQLTATFTTHRIFLPMVVNGASLSTAFPDPIPAVIVPQAWERFMLWLRSSVRLN